MLDKKSSALMPKPDILLAHGSFDTLIDKPDRQYEGITLAEIADMVCNPQATEKADAAFIIPSSYRAYDGRKHAAQREHGSFHYLAIDIDEGSPSLTDVKRAVSAATGDAMAMIYSSSGASNDNRKWRVLIPLADPISGADYSDTQSALFDIMMTEHGIKCDAAFARVGQPIYLPNVPPAKRDEHGQPLFYHQDRFRGKGYLDVKNARIWSNMQFRREQAERAEKQTEQDRAARQAARIARREASGDDLDPVAEFNARHTVEDMLVRCGYTRDGNSQSYASRYQSSGSFATKNFGEHWVSLSGSDVGATIGAVKGDYCWGDAFDLFCHYDHGGDMKSAVREYARELNPHPLMRSTQPQEDFTIDLSDFDEVAPIEAKDTPDEPFYAVDSKGNIVFNHHNAMEVLTKLPEWRNVFAFDEFAQRKMVVAPMPDTAEGKGSFKQRELRDDDYVSVIQWFNRNGFLRAGKGTICDVVDAACMKGVISPVKHWLERMGEKAKANPQPREYLDTWTMTMLGVKPQSDDHAEYVYEISRKWLISAVARALDAGCKADTVLILEGSQGAGKSTALRMLAGEQWFGDALPQMGTKDASDYLRGKWIVELAELSNINKAEVEIVKAFVSRNEERFRPAYGRSEICYPRQCIFAGTTNKADYLRDETGNRRFWPIKCGEINANMIKREREMLWGEAVRAYKSGEKWWLSGQVEEYARIEQENRLSADEWTGVVANYCEGRREVGISQIAQGAFEIQIKDVNRQTQNRISAILSAIGYVRDGQFSSGEQRGEARYVRQDK